MREIKRTVLGMHVNDIHTSNINYGEKIGEKLG